MKHPATELGEKRICPITKRQFIEGWSEEETFDVCDQCADEHETLARRLHKLNLERGRQRKEG